MYIVIHSKHDMDYREGMFATYDEAKIARDKIANSIIFASRVWVDKVVADEEGNIVENLGSQE